MLVRVYGANTDKIIDRAAEIENIKVRTAVKYLFLN